MDIFTADTIRNMCRYVADDGKIARHCRVEVADVRRVRRQLPKRNKHAGRQATIDRVHPGATEAWQRAVRRGSKKLLEALEQQKSNVKAVMLPRTDT